MKVWRWVLLAGWVAAACAPAFALPVRAGHVNDFAGVLSPEAVRGLEAFLAEHQRDTGRDHLVLIVHSLEGMTIDEYADAITEAWKLGDRHVLLLVGLEDKEIHISVGRALTPAYPDELLHAIVDDIAPWLAVKRYDEGISGGVRRLVGAGNEAALDPLNGVWRLVLLGGLVAVALGIFLFLRV